MSGEPVGNYIHHTRPPRSRISPLTSCTLFTIMTGRFIVFEGLDRSGKSTQVEKLAQHLNAAGSQAVVRKFPGAPSP